MAREGIDSQLGEILISLADSVRPGYGIVDTLDLLVQASTAFTSAVEAGVLLIDRDGRLRVGASTGERATDVEEEQMGVEGGPCIECIASGFPFEVVDIEAEGWKWPEFAITARARGLRGVHAIPMRLRQQSLGSLNLFFDKPGPLTDRDFVIVSALTQVAAISIVRHRSSSEQSETIARLEQALRSRAVIEQAKGIISQQCGIPVEQAFDLIRTYSRRHRMGLQSIAKQIVDQDLVLA